MGWIFDIMIQDLTPTIVSKCSTSLSALYLSENAEWDLDFTLIARQTFCCLCSPFLSWPQPKESWQTFALEDAPSYNCLRPSCMSLIACKTQGTNIDDTLSFVIFALRIFPEAPSTNRSLSNISLQSHCLSEEHQLFVHE